MSATTLTVRADAPIGTISPRIYGHFAEHLGRCAYDGLFTGSQRPDVPTENGFRTDVIQALRDMPTPMLRWPGGCYADHYHWRDGIGPVEERPIRLGMSCGLQVEDDNSLGTHEFMFLCQQIGAEPYLAGNMGSGSPQELADWIEYCNTRVATSLGKLRAANGSSEPFGVKLWGVGNENWGCGGNYEAATYAREYVRYATMLRHVEPGAELVTCGFEDEWNVTLLSTIGERHMNLVDHLSIHRYWVHGGPELDFSDDEYYALLTEAAATEDFVKRTAQIIDDATGGKRAIGIALDEWGVWHPEARTFGPSPVTTRDPVTYEQANTLRDALAAAIALEGFHHQAHRLSLCNLAQIVNVLQAPVMTDGARMWLTPTYYALKLHKPHVGATALPVDTAGGATLPDGTPAVTGTASRTAEGLALTLINRHLSDASTVTLAVGDAPANATGQILTAASPRDQNSAAEPDRVAIADLAVTRDGQGWRVELPAHSMATIVLR